MRSYYCFHNVLNIYNNAYEEILGNNWQMNRLWILGDKCTQPCDSLLNILLQYHRNLDKDLYTFVWGKLGYWHILNRWYIVVDSLEEFLCNRPYRYSLVGPRFQRRDTRRTDHRAMARKGSLVRVPLKENITIENLSLSLSCNVVL